MDKRDEKKYRNVCEKLGLFPKMTTKMKLMYGLRGPGESFRNDKTLSKQYKNFRKAYWRWRAQQIMEGKS